MDDIVFTTASEEETRRLGMSLGRHLNLGDVLCLLGDIGAGKTRLAQGVGQALDVGDVMTSPTFAFINEYHGSKPLMHADLYRVECEDEIEDLGLDEYLYGEWVCVIEWADRAIDCMPQDRLDITVEASGDSSRTIVLRPRGARYKSLCEVLSQSVVPRY